MKLSRIQIILLCILFIIFGSIIFGTIIYKIIKEKKPLEFPKVTNSLK